MEQDNEELVAFIRQDAEDVLRMLSSQPGQQPGPRRPPARAVMFGRTSATGIPIDEPGDVTIYTPTTTGWAASSPTQTVPCWAWPTEIVGEAFVDIEIVDGRFVATERC